MVESILTSPSRNPVDSAHLSEPIGQDTRESIGNDRYHPKAGKTFAHLITSIPDRDQESAAWRYISATVWRLQPAVLVIGIPGRNPASVIPSRILHARNCCQVLVKPAPIVITPKLKPRKVNQFRGPNFGKTIFYTKRSQLVFRRW